MGHLGRNGSQHEPNKNPGPLHDRKSHAKGPHRRPKRTTKLPHRIRLSRENSRHLLEDNSTSELPITAGPVSICSICSTYLLRPLRSIAIILT
jgi:hypothetical protein